MAASTTTEPQAHPTAEPTGVRKKGTLDELIEAGLATPPTCSIADLPPPLPRKPGEPTLTEILLEMRDEALY